MKMTLRIIKNGPHAGRLLAYAAGSDSIVYDSHGGAPVKPGERDEMEWEDVVFTDEPERQVEVVKEVPFQPTPFQAACIALGEGFVKEIALGESARRARDHANQKTKEFMDARTASRKNMASILVTTGDYDQEDADELCNVLQAQTEAVRLTTNFPAGAQHKDSEEEE